MSSEMWTELKVSNSIGVPKKDKSFFNFENILIVLM